METNNDDEIGELKLTGEQLEVMLGGEHLRVFLMIACGKHKVQASVVIPLDETGSDNWEELIGIYVRSALKSFHDYRGAHGCECPVLIGFDSGEKEMCG